MIASIQGQVLADHNDSLVIDVNGIGYKIFVPFSVRTRNQGQNIFLHTHLVVREDSLTLYGFSSPDELSLFTILLTINGVGPKVALAILNTLSADNLRNAVVADRAEILTRVPGIGKKTAQKILFELKDKLAVGLDAIPAAGFDDIDSDVIDTLVALGYSIVEAQTAIQSLPPNAPEEVEERVRLALQYFM
jgi:Holliday junction DNA helicase RuvA